MCKLHITYGSKAGNMSEYEMYGEALVLASRNGHIKVVEMLLDDERVDPKYNACEALYKAILFSEDIDIVKLLINHPRMNNIINIRGLLVSAIRRNSIELVKLLLDNKKKFIFSIFDYDYAIMEAARIGNWDIIEILLNHAKSLKHFNDFFHSNKYLMMISCASENGHLDVVKKILGLFDNYYEYNSEYYTKALNAALNKGYVEIVKVLLNDFKFYNKTQKVRNHVFKVASEKGYKDIVKLLLNDPCVDPSIDDNYAMKYACKNKHKDIVKMLIGCSNVDPSIENNYALECVIKDGDVELFKLLLKDKRVEISSETILLAAYYGCAEIVKLLMHSERISIVNIFDEDKLLNIIRKGYEDVAILLLKDERIYSSKNHNGISPVKLIFTAIKNELLEVVKYLLKDIELTDKVDLLEIACKEGYTEIVELILKDKKIDSSKFDHAMCYAACEGYEKIIELFLNYVK